MLPPGAFEHALRAFAATAPSAAGVLLARDDGAPLAYDLGEGDPVAIASAAVASRPEGSGGVLVESPAGPVLVVFLPLAKK